MPRHKHSVLLEFDVPHNPSRRRQFCRCGWLRDVYGADGELFRREYGPWRQAETLDELNDYLREMALAKDRH